MSHFERKSGEPITLRLAGRGIDTLRVNVSGGSASAEPVSLVNVTASAEGSSVLRVEHEFAPGQLDDLDELRVDPVVYGRPGAEYWLSVSLANASDEQPTVVDTFMGTLVASRRNADADGTGFDAPLCVVQLTSQFSMHWDESIGAFVLDVKLPTLPVKEFGTLLGGTVEPAAEPVDFGSIEPRDFRIGGDLPSSGAGLGGGLGTLGPDGGLGTGSGAGFGGLGSGGRGGFGSLPEEEGLVKKGRHTGASGKPVPKRSAVKKMAAIPQAPPADDTGKHYPVWYGTNRAPVIKDGTLQGYSPMRDSVVHYGRCVVQIPKSHKIGETGSPRWKVVLTRTDDRLKLEQLLEVKEGEFWRGLSAQLASVAGVERHAVVFIHGYNVTFHDAAIRAAQLGCDLNISGAMAFYSWPSRGSVDGYFADEATVQASAHYITDFLVDVAARSGAEQVHVIAHSMGNRAALEAVHDIVRTAGGRSRVPFSQFILAAPDVDADYFRQLANAYGAVAKRTTMYVSDRDHAVQASRFLHGGVPRVGLAPPFQVLQGIDTVYVGKIDDSLLGHGYVAEDRELLNDMHQLIHLDAAPAKRFSVRRSSDDTYWELVR